MTNYVTVEAIDEAKIESIRTHRSDDRIPAILERAAPYIARRVLEVAEQDIIKCHAFNTEPISHTDRTFRQGVRSALDCLAGLQAELNLEENPHV